MPSPSSWRRPSSSGSFCPATIGTATRCRRPAPRSRSGSGAWSPRFIRSGQARVRELGLGALQAWQALSEAQGRGRGKVDVAILFTDIVGFSSWALDAGDEAALELLRQVAAAEDTAISGNGGSLVKRLGDGAMAVFRAAEQAVRAALQAQLDVGRVEVNGHTPELRAGRPPRASAKGWRRLPRRRRQHRGAGRRGRPGRRGAGLRVRPRGPRPGGLQVRPQATAERDRAPRGTSRSAASASARRGRRDSRAKLSPKQGVVAQNAGGGWSHTVYTVTPGIPGDSGSGFLNASGQAIGILSTLQAAPVSGLQRSRRSGQGDRLHAREQLVLGRPAGARELSRSTPTSRAPSSAPDLTACGRGAGPAMRS